MQMQGSEAVWKLVLDAHLHCVYPGARLLHASSGLERLYLLAIELGKMRVQ